MKNRLLTLLVLHLELAAGLAQPVIIEQPMSRSDLLTTISTFSVTAIGQEPISYQWQFNGTDIPGATNRLLNLTNVRCSQAGIYAVIARNPSASVRSADATLTLGGVATWRPALPDLALTSVLPADCEVVAVAAGWAHGLALHSDGTVAAWGDYPGMAPRPAFVPKDLTNVVEFAASGNRDLALTADGRVAAWGIGAGGLIDGLSNVVAIALGGTNPNFGTSLALKEDGTVVAWGNNEYGQADVPQDLRNVVAITSGSYVSLAVEADGTVVQWGKIDYDVPNDLTNAIAITAGTQDYVALRADGTIGLWGYDGWDSIGALSNSVAIAAAGNYVLILNSEGVVQTTSLEPIGLPSSAIAVGGLYDASFGVSVIASGSPRVAPLLRARQAVWGAPLLLKANAAGTAPLAYQWRLNGINLPGATNATFLVKETRADHAGTYSVLVSNVLGVVTSSETAVSVVPLTIPGDSQPRSKTTFLGATVSFNIDAIGLSPFTYQWGFFGPGSVGCTIGLVKRRSHRRRLRTYANPKRRLDGDRLGRGL